LTAKNKPDRLGWKKTHQEAFEELRRRLVTSSILIAPDHNKPFQLTDASTVAIGAVLEQEKDGEIRPIAYFSRKLLPRERAYPITELEALAIVDAIEHFALYLLTSKFVVVTDHRALTYLNKMNNRSIRLTRWSHTLQPYDCTFKYCQGRDNQVADYLSRAPDMAKISRVFVENAPSEEETSGIQTTEETTMTALVPETRAKILPSTAQVNSANRRGRLQAKEGGNVGPAPPTATADRKYNHTHHP
jgi:hypothetical protein